MYKHKGTHFETARFLGLIFNRELARLVYLWVGFLKPKTSKCFFFQIARSIACVVALIASEGPLSVIQKLLGMVCKVVYLHIHVFFKQRIFYVVLLKVGLIT